MPQRKPSTIIRWTIVALFLLCAADTVRTPEPASIAPPGQWMQRVARTVYQYSVVPGGVYDRAEAATAVVRDRVVAVHYQGFDVGRATPVRNGRELRAFVSYRRGDHVYWTSRQVRVPAGELLLSDGAEMVRARCGNRVSDRPRMPTGFPEPTPLELESSLAPRGAGQETLVATEAPARQPISLTPPFLAVPGGETGRAYSRLPVSGGFGGLELSAGGWVAPSEAPFFPGHMAIGGGPPAAAVENPPMPGGGAPGWPATGGMPPALAMLRPPERALPAAAVPEPSSAPVLFLVIAGLFWYSKSRGG